MKFRVTLKGRYEIELEVELEGDNEALAIQTAQKRAGQYPLGTLPVCTLDQASAQPLSIIVPPTKH